MLTHAQIIASTAHRRLNLGQPRLRLLPPPTPEPVAEPTNEEALAWAKARRARGLRFVGVPVQPARKPRKRPSNDPALRYLQERDGVWYFRRWHKGRCVTVCLRTRDLAEAQRLREQLLTPPSQDLPAGPPLMPAMASRTEHESTCDPAGRDGQAGSSFTNESGQVSRTGGTRACSAGKVPQGSD